MRTLGVDTNDATELVGGDVSRGAFIGGEADEEFGVLALVALGDGGFPVVVVEVVAGGVADDQVAADVVVELDEDGVEFGLLDHFFEVVVGVCEGALGRGGDEDVGIAEAELLDHGDVGFVVWDVSFLVSSF